MGKVQRQLYAAFAGSICIFSYGMAYGWVSPVMNTLADKNGEIRATSEQINWIVAAIELGSLITPFFASYLMDNCGRKWPMLLAVPMNITSWCLTMFTRSVHLLYLKRLLDGMGMGLVLTVAPVYFAEIAEAEVRGLIIVSVAVTWYAGTLTQFCLGTYLSYNSSACVNLTFPILFFLLFVRLPESPYYLMMIKQDERAADSLAWYRKAHQNQVTEELNEIAVYLEEDAQNKESLTAMLSNKIYRKCLTIMIVIIVATILTGLTTIPNYASEMFADTGGFLNPDTSSVAIAFLFFMVSIITCFTIDRIGRRPLVVISAIGCSVSNFCSAIFTYYKDEIPYKWIPLVTIGSYCFFVTFGLAPIMVVFQGELFPSSVKGVASGLIMVFVTLTSFIALKCYHVVGESIGLHVNYLIYSVIAGASAIWLFYNAPETKNKTFNELFIDLERMYGIKTVQNPQETFSLNRDG